MIYWLLCAATTFCLVAGALPMLPVPHGIVRIFDFPRTQLLALSLIVLATLVLTQPINRSDVPLIFALLVAIAIQTAHIARFSPLWPHTVGPFKGGYSETASLKLFVSNVKQSNRDYQLLLNEIRRYDPDIALFMEVDDGWMEALHTVSDGFKDSLEHPQDNSYGMTLFSKFALEKKVVRNLLTERIPSFDCIVKLTEKTRFRLVTLHPEPPLPTDDTIGRDAEISLVGLDVENETLPVIVTGDLNDVAWSRTTRRFIRISGLLDPREGRGQYNSFDARWFFLRWPLDHIFCSAHFSVVSMVRLPYVGSDHFPMYYELALSEQNSEPSSNGEDATQDDVEEARELIDVERGRDRKPIGEDWENG